NVYVFCVFQDDLIMSRLLLVFLVPIVSFYHAFSIDSGHAEMKKSDSRYPDVKRKLADFDSGPRYPYVKRKLTDFDSGPRYPYVKRKLTDFDSGPRYPYVKGKLKDFDSGPRYPYIKRKMRHFDSRLEAAKQGWKK
ncbi:unnamed protein product, partial [Porites lobata]